MIEWRQCEKWTTGDVHQERLISASAAIQKNNKKRRLKKGWEWAT